ncbi:MAG: hypothetical protein HY887_06135 [Deltaproteobacteria bacterium]|nr:hypothetical protein [Deltaproteobacteria bacterium]
MQKLVDKYQRVAEAGKISQDYRNTSANTDKWRSLKADIEKIERQIDQKIYKLYEITSEEIQTIES